MWTHHLASEETEEERRLAADLLHEFTDKVMDAQTQPGEHLPNFEHAFVELTDALRSKMHRCDRSDPEELAVYHAIQSLLVRYGHLKLPKHEIHEPA